MSTESDWKDVSRKSVRYQTHASANNTDISQSRGAGNLNKSIDQADLNNSTGEMQSPQMLKVNTFVRFAFSMDTLIIDLLTCKEKRGLVNKIDIIKFFSFNFINFNLTIIIDFRTQRFGSV